MNNQNLNKNYKIKYFNQEEILQIYQLFKIRQ
jgi:hypothetical protein